MKPHRNTHISGLQPKGSCSPDGSHMWATRKLQDGVYYITEFNGWLITNETQTTDSQLAALISNLLVSRHGRPTIDQAA